MPALGPSHGDTASDEHLRLPDAVKSRCIPDATLPSVTQCATRVASRTRRYRSGLLRDMFATLGNSPVRCVRGVTPFALPTTLGAGGTPLRNATEVSGFRAWALCRSLGGSPLSLQVVPQDGAPPPGPCGDKNPCVIVKTRPSAPSLVFEEYMRKQNNDFTTLLREVGQGPYQQEWCTIDEKQNRITAKEKFIVHKRKLYVASDNFEGRHTSDLEWGPFASVQRLGKHVAHQGDSHADPYYHQYDSDGNLGQFLVQVEEDVTSFLQSDGVSYTYIMFGGSGSGKTTTTRALMKKFEEVLEKPRSNSNSASAIETRFAEIYRANIYDVRQKKTPDNPRAAGPRTAAKLRALQELNFEPIAAAGLYQSYKTANSHRVTKKTAFNPVSSRGHLVVQVQRGTSRFTILDCAGQENAAIASMVGGSMGGIVKDEGDQINSDLAALDRALGTLANSGTLAHNTHSQDQKAKVFMGVIKELLIDDFPFARVLLSVNPSFDPEQMKSAIYTLDSAKKALSEAMVLAYKVPAFSFV